MEKQLSTSGYFAPEVETVNINVEAGFAATGSGTSLPGDYSSSDL